MISLGEVVEKNRDPILIRKSLIDFSGIVFNRDRDRDFDLKIGSRLKK
jgi:hypothetical protein